MCDETIHVGRIDDPGLDVAAMVAGGGGPVVETAVSVTTPDGVCDAILMRPSGQGRFPAVLFWPDGAGLRPAIVGMARRLAAQGHVVLTPNPFYRTRPAPVFPTPFDFSLEAHRAMFWDAYGQLTPDGVTGDARAYLAFLDAQPQTDTSRKAGVQGYCMGGALSFRAAAAVPGRIGAVGSFHGGALVIDEATSPHKLIAKTQASFLVAVARDDDAQAPSDKDVLKAAFAEAGRPAVVEVYPGDHGWCVPGSQVYDEPAAEKAWAALTVLYKAALA
jgi:carboxymethylenebutenolidase